ncbi:hypothetical protein O6H91_22G018100 [Diphasiastrum complanatum]|uniref:Uncharacterized protein n=1 Tax=Diphasiastrum complanatum TaxID=34168 RepID=A0ACC2ADF4_DIPCM|nr:hypothetical protein O6H91_22G018100 [Diphasiastrum complanatum]
MHGFQRRRHTTHGCDGCNDVGETSIENEQIKPSNDKESLESARIKEACNLWQDRWLIDYPWLEFICDLRKVFCKVCKQQPNKLKNVFGSVGSTNIRASAWLDHGRSKQHKDIYKDQMEAERNALHVANMTILS